jgi:hypothetical protein
MWKCGLSGSWTSLFTQHTSTNSLFDPAITELFIFCLLVILIEYFAPTQSFISLILTDFFCSCASLLIHIPLLSRLRQDDKLKSSITRELFVYESLDSSTYSCTHLSHTRQKFYFCSYVPPT